MSIHDRVKHIRKVLNLTQVKFAERLAISAGHLAGMESGNKKVNERSIRLIISEFHVNEYWLKTGKGEIFNSEATEIVSQISKILKSLSPHFQECALKHVLSLSELESSLNSE